MFAWGVDFGTTNSGVAGFERGHFRTFGADLDRPFPSVVAVHQLTGEIVAVGEEARRRREELSANNCHVISSVKSVLGDPGKRWPVAGGEWTPEDAAAEILKALREHVADQLAGGQTLPEEAVFSIPVGFPMAKRQALRQSAKRAGFKIAHFVSEPTAAVCRHFDQVRRRGNVAVLDWGGGTLDISIIDIRGEEIRELAKVGERLGGDEIDRLIAKYIHGQFVKDGRLDIAFDQVEALSRDRLLMLSQDAKHKLSDGATEVPIDVLNYSQRGRMVTRLEGSTMVRLLEPQMRRCFEIMETAVRDKARLSFDQLGCLLMVGGSSKLLGLREYLMERVPCEILPLPDADGDWSIAKGAALLSSRPGEYVVAQELGLRISDETYFPLVREGQIVTPTKLLADQYFGLVEDEKEARFIFVQPATEKAEGSGDRSLEVLDYLNIPVRGFRDEPIRLCCTVDENHVFRVDVRSRAIPPNDDYAWRAWEYEHLRFAYRLDGFSKT